jgi:cytochrome P450
MSAPSDPIPLFGPEMRADPHPLYHQLRSVAPVYWSASADAWIVTGYDAVVAGLNDLRLSSDRAAHFEQLAGSDELKPFFAFLRKRMLLADPPYHTRLRGLVSKAFTPHVVEAMRPHIQQLVDGFLDAVQAAGRMDVVRDLAFPLPATVITEMLGVPPADTGRACAAWTRSWTTSAPPCAARARPARRACCRRWPPPTTATGSAKKKSSPTPTC